MMARYIVIIIDDDNGNNGNNGVDETMMTSTPPLTRSPRRMLPQTVLEREIDRWIAAQR